MIYFDRGISVLILLSIIFFQTIHAINGKSDTPRYRVKYHHANVPKNIAEVFVELNAEGNNNGSFEILKINREKILDQYICFIPCPPSSSSSLMEESSELNNTTTAFNNDILIKRAINELNKSFSNKKCVYVYRLNGGYWTYGYCFGDKVIQFHEDLEHFLKTGEHKPEYPDYIYVLGRFKDSSRKEVMIENQSTWTKSNLNESDFSINDDTISPFAAGAISKSQHNTQRFIQHTLTDGEICDLTKEPRSISVIYKCVPNHRDTVEIIDLQEIKTCHYQMIISVPRLCSLDEFVPNNDEGNVVDIDCKLIAKTNNIEPSGLLAQDFYNYIEQVPINEKVFPVPISYKITVSDYHLSPCGQGFYFGQSKEKVASPNLYFNFRTIIVYNAQYRSFDDLIHKLGRMLSSSVGTKILAPHFEAENKQSLLLWSDTFIMWFELYDFYGNLISLAKIKRNGTDSDKHLSIQLVDPETMLDQDGDLIENPVFEAPNNAWNFEKFTRNQASTSEAK